MNVVIISSFFYPVIQPRSFRATELAKEFARKGNRVSIITMNTVEGFDYEKYEHEYGISINHLNIFKGDGTAAAAGNNQSVSYLRKKILSLVRYLFCGYMIKYAYQIHKALLQQECMRDADMVIALSTPFCIHWGLAKYIKSKGKHFVSIADSGDPFYYSKQWNLAIWFKYIEKNVYKKMDFLTIPTANAIPLYSPLIPEKKIKIIPQGFNMRNLNLYKGDLGDRLKMAYAGVFYWDIRNPEFLFKYLDKCKKDYELHLYMRYHDAKLEEVLNSYPNLKSRIIINYNVPHDDLIYELSKMHFLVNIENLSNTQMPSKLIDYGMTGGPILSCNELNYSESVLDEFMNGDYSGKYIVNIDDYNIEKIVDHFVDLYSSCNVES